MKRAKLFPKYEYQTNRDLGDSVYFYCPACKSYHSARVRMPAEPTQEEIDDQTHNRYGLWTWNGNEEFPTINPSVLYPSIGCHFFIRDGKIQYCGDCNHEYANQTIDLPECDL